MSTEVHFHAEVVTVGSRWTSVRCRALLGVERKGAVAKLTESQLIVLSKAAAREDGAAVVPPKMNKASAVKTGSSLAGGKLMWEIRSKPGMPVWRADEDGRILSSCVPVTMRSASTRQMRPTSRLQARTALRSAPIVI